MGPNRNHGASAPRASTTPKNDKADGANVGRVGAGHKSESLDCAGLGDDRNALATLKVLAAMCGCTLHQIDGGGYMICKWGLARELPDLRAAGNLLRQIGGSHG